MTKEDLKQLCSYLAELFHKKKPSNSRDSYELKEFVYATIKHWNVKVYNFPCCSKLKDIFILGTCIKTYKRINVKCKECEEPFVCNKCLGYTENGYYDVNKIFEQVVEADESHLCKVCGNDNRESFDNCKFCKWKDQSFTEVKEFISLDDRIKTWIKDRPVKYYYMIDDCLSCT